MVATSINVFHLGEPEMGEPTIGRCRIAGND
jgi:hypothetical protein